MKANIAQFFLLLFESLIVWGYGKDRMLGFYVARISVLGLRHGVSRGEIHKHIDRCCILLWENR